MFQQSPQQQPSSRQTQQLGPFLGIVYALDNELIPDNAASDLRNVQIEDGRISQRYGFRNLNAQPAGWNAGYGFDYVSGISSAGTLVEEYISLEDHGTSNHSGIAGIYPYYVNVSTGVRTRITAGSSDPSPLTTPAYGQQPGIHSFSFNGNSYTVSPSESSNTANVWQHQVGTPNSWVQLANPAQPANAAPIVGYAQQADSGGNALGQMRWDDNSGHTLGSGAVTLGGTNSGFASAPSSGYTGATGALIVNFSNSPSSTNYAGSLTITVNVADTADHAPGEQNWTYIDRIVIPIGTIGVAFDTTSLQVTLTNAAGSTFNPTNISTGYFWQTVGPANDMYAVMICDFDAKSPRSNYQHIDKIEISFNIIAVYQATAIESQNYIQFDPIQLGNVNCSAFDQNGSPSPLVIGYTEVNSATGLESPIKPSVVVPQRVVNGIGVQNTANWQSNSGPGPWFYNRLKMYINPSPYDSGKGTTYDHYNIYALAQSASPVTWYQVATIPVGNTTASGPNTLNGTTYDASFDYQFQWSDVLASPSFSSVGSPPFQNVICGCAFNGGVVWGFKGGESNIKFSAIGLPTTLFNNADSAQLDPNNIGAPANFTLADDAADDPVAMFPVNSSLIVLGSKGVYATAGTAPAAMSPFKRLPTGLGCAGQFACSKWHDPTGNPGVAFMSRNGEGIYLAQEDPYFLNTVHYKILEMTLPVRNLIHDFLLAGSLSNIQYVRMGVDETRDALWVICKNLAMVYRRPSFADQQRHWELYQFSPSEGFVQFISFNALQRMRWIRSTGEVDENEWNSSSSSWISGALADGGNAMSPLPYYTTKTFVGFNRRIDRFLIDRLSLSDTPTLTDFSQRTPAGATVSVGSGRLRGRFGWLSQGEWHQFRIGLADGSGYVRRVEYDEIGPLSRRTLA